MGTTMVGMAKQGDDQPIGGGTRATGEGGRRAARVHAPETDGRHEASVSAVAGVSRRAAGALEAAVLGVLWDAAAALSPGEVREVLGRSDSAAGALSYSTVVTILTRLHEKGSLSRERDGRAYRYAPVADEAGLAARRLSQLLDRSTNREAVLSRFVADLSERDEDLLRSLLGEPISADSGNGIPAAAGTLADGIGVDSAAGHGSAIAEKMGTSANSGHVNPSTEKAGKRRGRG